MVEELKRIPVMHGTGPPFLLLSFAASKGKQVPPCTTPGDSIHIGPTDLFLRGWVLSMQTEARNWKKQSKERVYRRKGMEETRR